MTSADFSTTFEVLTSHPPFRWQTRLFRRFMDGRLPRALDLPTGLGKTSVMAIWLIALARGAKLPRRCVYVVDRRVVVDQATTTAELLRGNLPSAMANALHLQTGSLPVSTLRGGLADNREWLDDPSRSGIVVGTIDMVGSRLLFEGYGVSRGMRPVHAGLLGADALVVLDEAHLCAPFESLLRQVERERDGALGGRDPFARTPPFRLMSLSATGRDAGLSEAEVFRLAPEDSAEPVVRRRLHARKRLSVSEVAEGDLCTDLATRAIELVQKYGPMRILVYCDRRKDAVAVKREIDRWIQEEPARHECPSQLLVGARRVREREDLAAWLEEHGFLGGNPPPAQPTFLVATSAGEVGVDLDADHLVCDLVAFERMVQRLGRVNRRGGESRTASVDVFAGTPTPRSRSGVTDPAYVEQLRLHRARFDALRRLPPGEDGRRDASPGAMAAMKSGSGVSPAITPPPLFPELIRPVLDAWTLTSLREHAGRPKVQPWLRGWEEDEAAQTSVVWRTHLPRGEAARVDRTTAENFFSHAPVHATERLETESHRVVEWLLHRVRVTRQARRSALTSSNHDAAIGEETPRTEKADGDRNDLGPAPISELAPVCFLMDSAGDLRDSWTLNDLDARRRRPDRDEFTRTLGGGTLVVDARLGGLDRDGMLSEEEAGPTPAADDDERWSERIRVRVSRVSGSETGLNVQPPDGWQTVHTIETRFNDVGEALGLAIFRRPGSDTSEDARSVRKRAQTLRQHGGEVAAYARRFAEALGLASDEVGALELAGRLHDDGKAAPRWQRAMNAPTDGGPYAKTTGGGNLRLLEGYRHEFGSLLDAERTRLPEPSRDLILHLIASHHGYARPGISTRGCEQAPPSLLQRKAGEVARRFARLQKQYGPWGLAWREAILRAADRRASRELEERDA